MRNIVEQAAVRDELEIIRTYQTIVRGSNTFV
ncbi:MAG: hypothetical protein Q8807_04135 ['Waltheria sp.' little leaf phytoplasma]|nr:hypothetical protein ['Waltheria sp.' little leaf phytoplasma]